VHITADQTVPSSLRQVRAVVTQAAATLGEADAAWPASAVVDVGVYLAKSVSGSVDVVACGSTPAETRSPRPGRSRRPCRLGPRRRR